MNHWLDRLTSGIAPRWTFQRQRARMAMEISQRYYEGATSGRRTQGWKRNSSDAASATGPFVGRLRDVARDLVRNNPYAEAALATIVDHTVGYGIVARAKPQNPRTMRAWNAWANTTACDADGRHDLAGLQKLVMRSTAEAGEVLVRRRFRLPEDGLPIPMQIQVLEPDFLDTSKHGITLRGGGRIVYGVEFDGIGRKAAYWLFPEHPGSSAWPAVESRRVPAEGVLHIFKPTRPGSVRGASWFAPILLRMKDFDEFEDATLMKQKIAACLAVITSDVDGTAAPLGTANAATPDVDEIAPGAIINAAPGRSIEVVQPPSVREYADYVKTSLRSIAAGLGVTYEDLTGDYTALPFSAARMSRLRHWARIEDWRWRMLIPQFCDPVWQWAMAAAAVTGIPSPEGVHWTCSPMPMIEPDKEALAGQRLIRTGLQSLSETLRERGYDPDEVLAEMAADNKKLDELGLKLDCDPRYFTQAGQLQSAASGSDASDGDESEESEGGTEDDDESEDGEDQPDDDDEEETEAARRGARR